jgi:hypothetical protein
MERSFFEVLAVWMDDPCTATRDELADNCTRLFLAVTAGAADDYSHLTSSGVLSGRSPRQLGWRRRPSDVRSL